MDFEYRPMTARDAEAWLPLRIEGARDFPMGFLATEAEIRAVSLEKTREILAVGAMRCVTHNGAIVGYCGYKRAPQERLRHRVETGPFFVRLSHHGTGAARVMMEGVKQEARADGCACVDLMVDSKNPRAIAFYERMGFALLAVLPDIIRIDGIPRVEHHYRCML